MSLNSTEQEGEGIVVPSASPVAAQEKSFSDPNVELVQKVLKDLFDNLSISDVYYIDDLFEIIDDYPNFSGTFQELLGGNQDEQLRGKFPEINFDRPIDLVLKNLKDNWDDNPQKRPKYLARLFEINGADADFKKDSKSLASIDTYFPLSVKLHKLSPTNWLAKREEIIKNLSDGKTLFLFDQVLTHSGAAVAGRSGIDFIAELISKDSERTFSGLLTHSAQEDEEHSKRKLLCSDRGLPIKNVFLLSKKRTEKPIKFAEGIKAALLNTSCEIIKRMSIEILDKAHNLAKERIEKIDAHAFDHVVVRSSFEEGIWETETLLRINNFLFQDYAKYEILSDASYREVVNKELDIARSISRVKVSDNQYNDHLLLRHQELYEPSRLINQLNSPIKNGDIFEIHKQGRTKKYILLNQPCDLIVRKEGERKSTIGLLVEIDEFTYQSLKNEVAHYYEKDPMRVNYFSDKYKLPYFIMDGQEVKNGVVDFDKTVEIDVTVLDLAVFNSSGECKINLNTIQAPTSQLQSSWKKRFEFVVKYFTEISEKLETYKATIDTLPDHQETIKSEIWSLINPTISFISDLGIRPSYNGKVFDFGIRRVLRYRKPYSTTLLNRYTRHIARDAEDHDFAD